MAVSAKKRILCVDDSQDSCELLEYVLSEAGYAFESAQSIAECLQVAKHGSFDLYFVDLSLPDGSGFDLIQKVREFDATVPIVVCSGDVRDSIQAEAARVGVQTFLTKPIDPEHVVQLVTEILN